MSAAGTGELQLTMNANMYCDTLKQSMIVYLNCILADVANVSTLTAVLILSLCVKDFQSVKHGNLHFDSARSLFHSVWL